MTDQGSGVGPLWGSSGGAKPEGVPEKDKVRKPEASAESQRVSESGSAGETDLVEISGPAKQVARLRELIRQTPDVRSQKVMEIKNRVDRGEYHVPAREILRKMVEAAVAEARSRRKDQ
ncbi:MAG: flagellar biosynthesis anti-sigma factor FlgM [Leptospirales bacterium]